MADAVSIASAGAASAAAILAGVNLYVSGRRERQRWLREALVDVFATYLAASFDTGAVSDKLARRRLAGAPPGELEDLAKRVDELHREQINALTRIRLLADGGAVAAAQDLHLADHADRELAEQANQVGSEALWLQSSASRDAFIVAAKRSMGIHVRRGSPSLQEWNR